MVSLTLPWGQNAEDDQTARYLLYLYGDNVAQRWLILRLVLMSLGKFIVTYERIAKPWSVQRSMSYLYEGL
jgi:hypothetical protein